MASDEFVDDAAPAGPAEQSANADDEDKLLEEQHSGDAVSSVSDDGEENFYSSCIANVLIGCGFSLQNLNQFMKPSQGTNTKVDQIENYRSGKEMYSLYIVEPRKTGGKEVSTVKMA